MPGEEVLLSVVVPQILNLLLAAIEALERGDDMTDEQRNAVTNARKLALSISDSLTPKVMSPKVRRTPPNRAR